MAKAQLPPEEGDLVEILKDDEFNGMLGTIIAVNPDESIVVKFDSSDIAHDYTPDEVILLVD